MATQGTGASSSVREDAEKGWGTVCASGGGAGRESMGT